MKHNSKSTEHYGALSSRPLAGKKRRWDAILVGMIMIIAFSALMIKILNYEVSCQSWPATVDTELCLRGVEMAKHQESQITNYLQNFLWELLQFPQNNGLW